MKKTLFSLALLLVIGQMAWAQTQTTVTTAEGLFEAVTVDGSYVKLGQDITIGSYLYIQNEKTITLDLNGYTLTRTGAESDKRNGQVIFVDESGNLTLRATGGGTITGGYAINGGGINNWGTLTINGGTISGNKAVVNDDNGEGRGAGIYNKAGATLTITAGTITGNEAVGNAHGGAGIFNDGTLNMEGGLVTNNKAADGHGGGIKNYGTLNMKGEPEVKDNTGGDVWLGAVNGVSTYIQFTGSYTGGSSRAIGIEMEVYDRFAKNFSSSGGNIPFFSTGLRKIGVVDGKCYIQYGYYECSWDETNKEVERTLKYTEPGDKVYFFKNVEHVDLVAEGTKDAWGVAIGNVNIQNHVKCFGTARIILTDNARLVVGGGIKVNTEDNAKLYIYSQSNGDAKGVLESRSPNSEDSGIGSGDGWQPGPIEIHGGNITAEGGKYGAGIGGGDNGRCGTITIYDGIVTATGGDYGAGIGSGDEPGAVAENDVVTIYGGTVTAKGGKEGAGIGGGNEGQGVKVVIYGGKVDSTAGSLAAGIGGGDDASGGTLIVYGGTVVAAGGKNGAGIGAGENLYTVISSDLDLHGGTFTIYGGNVRAIGGENAAGIGGGYNGKGATITIEDGFVNASAGMSAAGIGGGAGYSNSINTIHADGGVVTIKGGEVNAFGGASTAEHSYSAGAGIGGGFRGSQGGTITITGGEVYAKAGDRDESSDRIGGAAGIGGGGKDNQGSSNGGEVIISGGSVRAFGANRAAGIGGGYKGEGCTLTVSDGEVEAYGGEGAAGIGGGYLNTGHNVTISGGKVMAVSRDYYAFGKGQDYNGEDKMTLSINGGTLVRAGANEDGATLRIADERVDACKENKFAILEPCSDHNCNFIDVLGEGQYHLGMCIYCKAQIYGPHEFDTTTGSGSCTVCGFSATNAIWNVELIYPMLDANGYCTYEDGNVVFNSVVYTVFKGKDFYFPACLYVPKRYEFVGWVVGSTSTSLEPAEGATLRLPGDLYTPTANVKIKAHYKSIDIELANNSNNDGTILKYHDMTANSVTLKDRVLYKDGSWNTLCLPFNVTDFTGTPLAGATVKTLSSATFDDTEGTLTLNFSDDLTSIEAGKPYIVKWAATSPNFIKNPVFMNVTFSSEGSPIAPDVITFQGIYSPLSIEAEDKTMLYLGADNTLYYPNDAMTIGAFRAYFQLNDITAGTLANGDIKSFVLNFGDEETGITNTNQTNQADAWYTIDGRRLDKKPAQRGLYINNGKKLVIK